MYKSLLKPTIDFLAAFIGFIVLSPIFLIVTILLLVANQGKPFRQKVNFGFKRKISKW